MLTGLNGTGKSTVVQTLLLARQFADAPARKVVQLNGPYGLALGEAHEVQHPDAPDSVIGVRVECDGGRRVCDMRFTVPDEQALYLDASRPRTLRRTSSAETAARSPICAPSGSVPGTSSTSPRDTENLALRHTSSSELCSPARLKFL
ncbi:hypothetical protein SCALM49S_10239 [Streptomyces californicus]